MVHGLRREGEGRRVCPETGCQYVGPSVLDVGRPRRPAQRPPAAAHPGQPRPQPPHAEVQQSRPVRPEGRQGPVLTTGRGKASGLSRSRDRITSMFPTARVPMMPAVSRYRNTCMAKCPGARRSFRPPIPRPRHHLVQQAPCPRPIPIIQRRTRTGWTSGPGTAIPRNGGRTRQRRTTLLESVSSSPGVFPSMMAVRDPRNQNPRRCQGTRRQLSMSNCGTLQWRARSIRVSKCGGWPR